MHPFHWFEFVWILNSSVPVQQWTSRVNDSDSKINERFFLKSEVWFYLKNFTFLSTFGEHHVIYDPWLVLYPDMGVEPKIGVVNHPKWMVVYNGKPYEQWMIWWFSPIFGGPPISTPELEFDWKTPCRRAAVSPLVQVQGLSISGQPRHVWWMDCLKLKHFLLGFKNVPFFDRDLGFILSLYILFVNLFCPTK